jgi:hypothetical protein
MEKIQVGELKLIEIIQEIPNETSLVGCNYELHR